MSAHKENNKKMDEAINDCLKFAKDGHSEDSQNYGDTINNARKIVDLKNEYNSQKHDKIVKAVGAVSSIICVGMMLAFERSNAITTKALPFFPKPRI